MVLVQGTPDQSVWSDMVDIRLSPLSVFNSMPVDRQPVQLHVRDATWQLLAPCLRQMAVFEFGEQAETRSLAPA